MNVTERVIADRHTKNALADGQGGFSIVLLLGGAWRCHPNEDGSAERGKGSHVCSLSS